ncbi:MAG: hypothetical protein ACI3XR_03165 [Eubacteriales bacterium]
MFRKYPKKLLKALLYLLFCNALSLPFFMILRTVLAAITQNQTIQSVCCLIVPAVILAVFTYKRRLNFQDMRREFVEMLENRSLSAKERVVFILKSSDFICELFAFLTVLVPLIIIYMISSIWNVILVLPAILLFVICDLFAWYFVYRKWESERIRKYN